MIGAGRTVTRRAKIPRWEGGRTVSHAIFNAEFRDHVLRRVRLTGRRADNKVGTTRFQWVNGLSKAWRVGCDLFVTVFSRYPEWHDRKTVMLYGCQEVDLELPQWDAG